MVASHGRFVWYELMTTDVKAAKAFYGQVVGWGARDVPATGSAYGLFTAGDAPVAGVISLPAEAVAAGAQTHWIGYVGVDDVDAAVERATQLGGAVRQAPTDLPDVSRFAVVADPQSAALALVKGRRSPPAQAGGLGAPGRVGWHELLAVDWETASAFYAALFGWREAGVNMGFMGAYQRFAVGGETIGGMFSKPPELPFPFWLYYFNVGEIEAAADRVEAGGGQILFGPIEAPGGACIAHCTDPQGAIFALLERRPSKPVGYFTPRAPVAKRDRP